ncbi:hypothetical protein GCM10029964_077740 [Kibdelosporangium lantanae]
MTVAPTVQDVDNAPLDNVNVPPFTVALAVPGNGPGNTTPSATAYVGSPGSAAAGRVVHPLAKSAVVTNKARVHTAGSSRGGPAVD